MVDLGDFVGKKHLNTQAPSLHGTQEPHPKGLGSIRLPLEHQLALPKHLLPGPNVPCYSESHHENYLHVNIV